MAVGSCLCGAVSFQLIGDPESPANVCYCTDCRKGSGSLCQITLPFRIENVKIYDPGKELREFVVTNTRSGKPKKKFFCGGCGCTIYTQPNLEMAKYFIRPTLLDDAPIGPFIEQCNMLFTERRDQLLGSSAPTHFTV